MRPDELGVQRLQNHGVRTKEAPPRSQLERSKW